MLEPPLEVFDGTSEPDTYASCDARHFVLVTVGMDPGELAYDFALPQ